MATVSDSSRVSELPEHACAHHCGHKAQATLFGKMYMIGGMQRVSQPQLHIYMQAEDQLNASRQSVAIPPRCLYQGLRDCERCPWTPFVRRHLVL